MKRKVLLGKETNTMLTGDEINKLFKATIKSKDTEKNLQRVINDLEKKIKNQEVATSKSAYIS